MVIYDSFVTSVHIKHVSYISPDVAFKDQQDICLELKCSILVIEYNHSDWLVNSQKLLYFVGIGTKKSHKPAEFI